MILSLNLETQRNKVGSGMFFNLSFSRFQNLFDQNTSSDASQNEISILDSK